MTRRPRAAAAFVLCAAFAPPASAAQAPKAELGCAVEPSPGRVVCRLDLEVDAGRLVWADALVVVTPEFARPLRSRIGAREVTFRAERRAELPVVFVAESLGTGQVEVVARAVVCTPSEGGAELCTSVARRVQATLEVGIRQEPPR